MTENDPLIGQNELAWLPQALLLAEPALLLEGDVLRPGDLCPRCHTAALDYDGLLNLACPGCGFTLSGCFT